MYHIVPLKRCTLFRIAAHCLAVLFRSRASLPLSPQACTFLLHNDRTVGPDSLADVLAELEHPQPPENVDINVQTPQFSATIFDDVSGVVSGTLAVPSWH